MKSLLLLVLCVFASSAQAQRTYWVLPIDTLAAGRLKHTHVQVTGKVSYIASETDGDTHIKLLAPSGKFIVAECIPLLPCAKPKLGATITVYGITRWDPEHEWGEVHPVEHWEIPPGGTNAKQKPKAKAHDGSSSP